jgi:hypothetical protein
MPADSSATITPEQHALVRRRALPVTLAGVLLGALALVLALTTPITAFTAPSLLAANLAFCAMLIGAAMLFYIRATPCTRPAAIAAIASLLLGMAATCLFTWQSVQSRQARENLELANLRAIATAAHQFAAAHQGAYPSDLLALLQAGLDPRTLQSPYGQHSPVLTTFATVQKNTPPENLAATVAAASDYLYLAADLKDVPKDAAPALLVAVSKNTIMRVNLAVAFADGTSRLITVEEVRPIVDACDAARAKVNLPPFEKFSAIQSAMDEKKSR